MKLERGTQVRFTADALARKGPDETRRYAGRTGEVTGYRMGADAPIVTFPQAGRRKEVRLFEVNPRDLEVLPAHVARGGD
jgi:ribosomal protein L21E